MAKPNDLTVYLYNHLKISMILSLKSTKLNWCCRGLDSTSTEIPDASKINALVRVRTQTISQMGNCVIVLSV